MDDQKFNYLKETYPLTFKPLHHIECEDGWFDILETLAKGTEPIIQSLPFRPNEIEHYFEQIKQKYGDLRCYFSTDNYAVETLIITAERQARVTCEMCSSVGELRGDISWIQVLCTTCNDKNKHRRKR